MAPPTSDAHTASRIALSLSEKDFTTKVIDRAQWMGWLVFHPLAARTHKGWRTAGQGTPEGFPDLVLSHPETRRTLFVELKTEKGRLTDAQKVWLEALNGHVWRPSDWAAITATLDGEEVRVSRESPVAGHREVVVPGSPTQKEKTR